MNKEPPFPIGTLFLIAPNEPGERFWILLDYKEGVGGDYENTQIDFYDIEDCRIISRLLVSLNSWIRQRRIIEM